MKKALKIVLISLGSALVLAFAFLVLLWARPQLILNDGTLAWALRKQAALSFKTDSGGPLHLQAERIGLSRLRLRTFTDSRICIEVASAGAHSCLEKFDLALEIHFRSLKKIQLSRLGPIFFSSQDTVVAPPPSHPDPRPSQPSHGLNVRAWVEQYLDPQFQLERVSVHIAPIRLILPGGRSQAWTGSIDLDTQENSQNMRAEVQAQGPSSEKISTTVEFSLLRDSSFSLGVTSLAQINKKLQARLAAKGKGNLNQQTGELTGSGDVNGLSDLISKLEITRFYFNWGEDSHLALDGDLHLKISPPQPREKSAVSVLHLDPKVSIQLEARACGSKSGCQFKFALLPVHQHGVEIFAQASGSIGTTFNIADLVLSQFDLGIRVPEFRKTVISLQDTRVAVPAPFNALQGPAEISVKLASPVSAQTLDLRSEIHLKSKTQALDIRTTGTLKKRKGPDGLVLDTDVVVQKLRLQLPDIDPLRPLPSLSHDSRIQIKKGQSTKTAKKGTEEPPFFETHIKVQTDRQPIEVLYTHFEPSALSLANLKIDSNSGLTGGFDIQPFQIHYLRQSATVQKLQVHWTEDTDTPTIHGRLAMDRLNHKIFADLEETPDATTISLSSEPPLAQEDIISLLLFNQLSNQLDASDSQSAQSTQSAITSRALGIFSLFALSSTPIESINYDPTTQTYSARVKLTGGVTAEVGSNWDKAQVYGLRKSIGKDWILSTTVRSEEGNRPVNESFLDWYRRF